MVLSIAGQFISVFEAVCCLFTVGAFDYELDSIKISPSHPAPDDRLH